MCGIFTAWSGVFTQYLRGNLMSDDELLARLKAGDETALGDLAEAYSGKIYQLAFRYLRNKEDAEEVTQDVLYKVYRKVDAFRGDAALVVVDLPDHVQRRDVAAAERAVSAVARRRSATRDKRGRRDRAGHTPGGRRLVGFGGRACVPFGVAAARLAARFSRSRPSIARRSCCATFRACRPKKPARCCA